LMGRAYNVVDADGHVLEPLDLWDNYMEPKFRDRAPRLIKDKDGKERLVIEEQVLGSAQAGLGGAGGVGARQGVVASNTMEYKEGRKGGFDPHARMPDMDADGIEAVFLYPSRSGRRRRISISRSASTKAPAAACRRSASTGSKDAARGISSPTRWK